MQKQTRVSRERWEEAWCRGGRNQSHKQGVEGEGFFPRHVGWRAPALGAFGAPRLQGRSFTPSTPGNGMAVECRAWQGGARGAARLYDVGSGLAMILGGTADGAPYFFSDWRTGSSS